MVTEIFGDNDHDVFLAETHRFNRRLSILRTHFDVDIAAFEKLNQVRRILGPDYRELKRFLCIFERLADR